MKFISISYAFQARFIVLHQKIAKTLNLDEDDKRQTVMNKVYPSSNLDARREETSTKKRVILNSKSSKIVAAGAF